MRRHPSCHPDRPYAGRDLCENCYKRARKNGTIVDHPTLYRPRQDFLVDYRVLRSRGFNRYEIAEKLGITRSGVDKALGRARRAGEIRKGEP